MSVTEESIIQKKVMPERVLNWSIAYKPRFIDLQVYPRLIYFIYVLQVNFVARGVLY